MIVYNITNAKAQLMHIWIVFMYIDHAYTFIHVYMFAMHTHIYDTYMLCCMHMYVLLVYIPAGLDSITCMYGIYILYMHIYI